MDSRSDPVLDSDLQALVDAYRPGSTDAAVKEALRGLWRAVKTELPEVTLSPAAFGAALGARAGEDLASIHAADLYLAIACLAGDAAAIRRLDERVIARLDKAVVSVKADPDFLDEVRQLVRERLLVAKPPRLAEYGGKGTLLGWARTIAVRLGLNHLRSTAKERPTGDDALLEAPMQGRDMEFEYVRQQHRGDFVAAFREALESLDPKAKNVLRLSFVDRLSIDQIGAMYGTHRATAARWVNGAREQLVEGTRNALATRLKLDPQQLDSLLGALQSNIEISLRGMLGPS